MFSSASSTSPYHQLSKPDVKNFQTNPYAYPHTSTRISNGFRSDPFDERPFIGRELSPDNYPYSSRMTHQQLHSSSTSLHSNQENHRTPTQNLFKSMHQSSPDLRDVHQISSNSRFLHNDNQMIIGDDYSQSTFHAPSVRKVVKVASKENVSLLNGRVKPARSVSATTITREVKEPEAQRPKQIRRIASAQVQRGAGLITPESWKTDPVTIKSRTKKKIEVQPAVKPTKPERRRTREIFPKQPDLILDENFETKVEPKKPKRSKSKPKKEKIEDEKPPGKPNRTPQERDELKNFIERKKKEDAQKAMEEKQSKIELEKRRQEKLKQLSEQTKVVAHQPLPVHLAKKIGKRSSPIPKVDKEEEKKRRIIDILGPNVVPEMPQERHMNTPFEEEIVHRERSSSSSSESSKSIVEIQPARNLETKKFVESKVNDQVEERQQKILRWALNLARDCNVIEDKIKFSRPEGTQRFDIVPSSRADLKYDEGNIRSSVGSPRPDLKFDEGNFRRKSPIEFVKEPTKIERKIDSGIVRKSGRLSLLNKNSTNEFQGVDLPGIGNLRDPELQNLIRRDRAATKIQSTYRGYRVRKSINWTNERPKEIPRNSEKAKRKARNLYETVPSALDLRLSDDRFTVGSTLLRALERRGEKFIGATPLRTREKFSVSNDEEGFKMKRSSESSGAASSSREKPKEKFPRKTGRDENFSSSSSIENFPRNSNRKGFRSESSDDHPVKPTSNPNKRESPLESSDDSSVKRTLSSERSSNEENFPAKPKERSVRSNSFDRPPSQKPSSSNGDGNRKLPEKISDLSDSLSLTDESSTTPRPQRRSVSPPMAPLMSSDNGRPIRPTNFSFVGRPSQSSNDELRYSPNALERQLHAEFHLLDGVDASMKQIENMERLRSVTLAQQEVVSLAQILRNKNEQMPIVSRPPQRPISPSSDSSTSTVTPVRPPTRRKPASSDSSSSSSRIKGGEKYQEEMKIYETRLKNLENKLNSLSSRAKQINVEEPRRRPVEIPSRKSSRDSSISEEIPPSHRSIETISTAQIKTHDDTVEIHTEIDAKDDDFMSVSFEQVSDVPTTETTDVETRVKKLEQQIGSKQKQIEKIEAEKRKKELREREEKLHLQLKEKEEKLKLLNAEISQKKTTKKENLTTRRVPSPVEIRSESPTSSSSVSTAKNLLDTTIPEDLPNDSFTSHSRTADVLPSRRTSSKKDRQFSDDDEISTSSSVVENKRSVKSSTKTDDFQSRNSQQEKPKILIVPSKKIKDIFDDDDDTDESVKQKPKIPSKDEKIKSPVGPSQKIESSSDDETEKLIDKTKRTTEPPKKTKSFSDDDDEIEEPIDKHKKPTEPSNKTKDFFDDDESENPVEKKPVETPREISTVSISSELDVLSETNSSSRRPKSDSEKPILNFNIAPSPEKKESSSSSSSSSTISKSSSKKKQIEKARSSSSSDAKQNQSENDYDEDFSESVHSVSPPKKVGPTIGDIESIHEDFVEKKPIPSGVSSSSSTEKSSEILVFNKKSAPNTPRRNFEDDFPNEIPPSVPVNKPQPVTNDDTSLDISEEEEDEPETETKIDRIADQFFKNFIDESINQAKSIENSKRDQYSQRKPQPTPGAKEWMSDEDTSSEEQKSSEHNIRIRYEEDDGPTNENSGDEVIEQVAVVEPPDPFRIDLSDLDEQPISSSGGSTTARRVPIEQVAAIEIVVPHSNEEINELCHRALDVLLDEKFDLNEPFSNQFEVPEEFFLVDNDANEETRINQRSHCRMIFDLCSALIHELSSENLTQVDYPQWQNRKLVPKRYAPKIKPRTRQEKENFVKKNVFELLRLDSRPSVQPKYRVAKHRRPDAERFESILDEEIRRTENQWLEYDEDQTKLQFDTADKIFESLFDETIAQCVTIMQQRFHQNSSSTRL